jgi:hypothetical protein
MEYNIPVQCTVDGLGFLADCSYFPHFFRRNLPAAAAAHSKVKCSHFYISHRDLLCTAQKYLKTCAATFSPSKKIPPHKIVSFDLICVTGTTIEMDKF